MWCSKMRCMTTNDGERGRAGMLRNYESARAKGAQGVYLQSIQGATWFQPATGLCNPSQQREIGGMWMIGRGVASVCLLISAAAAPSSSSLPLYPPLPPLQAGQSNFDSQPEQTFLNWWVSISRIFLFLFKSVGSISMLGVVFCTFKKRKGSWKQACLKISAS